MDAVKGMIKGLSRQGSRCDDEKFTRKGGILESKFCDKYFKES